MDILIDRPIGTDVGEISAAAIKSQLAKANGQPIVVRIHSEGGSVFDGLAMYDAFKSYPGPKRCVIESAAFSMASVVAMAFENREITENGYVMLHAPYSDDGQDTPVLESLRQRLASIYSTAIRKPKQTVEKMMSAETFLDSAEALRAGFVTAISGTSARAVASLRSMVCGNARFRTEIVARLKDDTTMTPTQKWNAAFRASMAATNGDANKAMKETDKKFPGLRQSMIQDANQKRK